MKLSRRDLLSCIPAGAALSAVVPLVGAAPGPHIGCQTNAWALKPNDFGQFLDVLRTLKSLGFEGFETSFRNVQTQYATAAAARAQIERTGLVCYGVHIFLNEYDPLTRIAPMDMVRATADGAAALGAQRVIVSGGGLVRDGKVGGQDLAHKVGGLDAAARYCRGKGLAFAYHNHGPEFAAGGAEINGLITGTDPALVEFLIDCGHAYRAGVNLAGFFTTHRTRIAGLHLRDFKGEPQVPLGQGDVDWAPLAAAVKKSGWSGWGDWPKKKGPTDPSLARVPRPRRVTPCGGSSGGSMKRREFLAATGGVALSALSYRRVLGANDRLGVALIGSGRRGREVMRAFLATGRADLRCIADIYDVQRQRAREVFGVTAPEMTTHEEALARKDVDAVLVGVPDHLHLSLTLAALEAGKHVYMEKPTTHVLDEGPRLIAAVRKSGKVCQTGTQQRSGAHYKRAKAEYLDTGKLGKVIFVRAAWSDFPWQRRTIAPAPQPAGFDWNRFIGPAKKVPYEWIRYDSWRYYPDYGGGLLADILTHWADVAQWFLNETRPQNAVATGGIYQLHDGRENPDTVSAILQYAGGWNLHFESSVLPLKTQRPSVFFQGTEGSLDIARDGYIYRPNAGQPVEQTSKENLELAHVTDFLDAVKEGRKPSADIEIGVQACNPIHLAKTAYWRKKRMRFAAQGLRIEEDT